MSRIVVFRMSIPLFALAAVLMVGSTWAQVGSPPQAVDASRPNYSLVGYWAGVSYLDEEKLQAKYAQLTDPQQKEALVKSAEAFLSMVVAAQYKSNGLFESDVEMISVGGDQLRETVTGTWRIAETKGLKMLVEFQERTADGTGNPVKKFYQFYEDGLHVATPVETGPELADLNPLIVFERLTPEMVAELEKMTPPKVDR